MIVKQRVSQNGVARAHAISSPRRARSRQGGAKFETSPLRPGGVQGWLAVLCRRDGKWFAWAYSACLSLV